MTGGDTIEKQMDFQGVQASYLKDKEMIPMKQLKVVETVMNSWQWRDGVCFTESRQV